MISPEDSGVLATGAESFSDGEEKKKRNSPEDVGDPGPPSIELGPSDPSLTKKGKEEREGKEYSRCRSANWLQLVYPAEKKGTPPKEREKKGGHPRGCLLLEEEKEKKKKKGGASGPGGKGRRPPPRRRGGRKEKKHHHRFEKKKGSQRRTALFLTRPESRKPAPLPLQEKKRQAHAARKKEKENRPPISTRSGPEVLSRKRQPPST